MPTNLRDVARDFGRGEATLETLRAAARTERGDRELADQVLKLIMDWETGGQTHSDRSRTDLRLRVKQLVPAAPTAPASSAASGSRRPAGESLYAAGLRGQRRRG